MGNIKILSPEIIAQIKAGEVIERPASIVKELVENALDAKASHITVWLREGGIEQITVSDNGIGMDEADLALACTSHATSKLRAAIDLFNISTLGFRGEALASIAAVSQITIDTKTAQATTGWRLQQSFGKTPTLHPIGKPVGTTVTVAQLFANLPVRQKFLQQPTTELRHSIRYLSHVSLAHPGVSFRLLHNDQVVLDLPVTSDISERVATIWGNDLSQQLLPIVKEENGFKVAGYITKPQAARTTIRHQYILINGRPVKQSSLSPIVRTAYGTLLPPKFQPAFVLDIQLPTNQIDVNIHPRKEEVALLTEATITQLLHEAVQQKLHEQDLTYRYHINEAAGVSILRDEQADAGTTGLLKKTAQPWDVRTVVQPTDDILQIHKLYLIVPTEAGVMLIDQHAAHERILYEQFTDQFKALTANSEVVTLATPVLFDVPITDIGLFTEQLPVLQQLGFDIENFGQQTFKVTAVLELFSSRNIPLLLQEVIEDLVNKPGITNLDHVTHKAIAYLACRSAIKAGDSLNISERRNLVTQLSQTKTQYTCPHGRPVQVEMSLPELHRLFKRS